MPSPVGQPLATIQKLSFRASRASKNATLGSASTLTRMPISASCAFPRVRGEGPR